MKRKALAKSRKAGRPAAPSKSTATAPARKRVAAKAPARKTPDKIINNLYEAKLNLSRLVDRAAAGEEIVIAKNGKPMARLVPLPPRPKREPGGWEGKVWEAPDCWAPMTEEELQDWEGGPIEPPA